LQWETFAHEHPEVLRNMAVSTGTSDEEFAKVHTPTLYFSCTAIQLDVQAYWSISVSHIGVTMPDCLPI
jgi:hypothetical protein